MGSPAGTNLLMSTIQKVSFYISRYSFYCIISIQNALLADYRVTFSDQVRGRSYPRVPQSWVHNRKLPKGCVGD